MGLPTRKCNLWVACVILQSLTFDLRGECMPAGPCNRWQSVSANSVSLRPRTDLLLRS